MKDVTSDILEQYCLRYPFLSLIKQDIIEAFHMIDISYQKGGKLLLCGNGGSAADADHIAGELLKGFTRKRKLSQDEKVLLQSLGERGSSLSEKLQGGLPAINLCAQTSLITAVLNDIGGEEIFAQQVWSYGKPEDILIGISTSGNAINVVQAGIVAKAKKMISIALTGQSGGEMKSLFDCIIRVPSINTADIQDMHSSVYHLLCTMVEVERWDV